MPPEAEPNETLAEMPVVVNSEVFSMYLFFLSDCALVLNFPQLSTPEKV